MSVVIHTGPPIHNARIGDWQYLGSVSSIHDDTEKGLDDVYVRKEAGKHHLLRAWGDVHTNNSYLMKTWTLGEELKLLADPYWEAVVLACKEKGISP